MSAQAEVHLWQTTAENGLVVGIDLTVTVDIAVVAVTDLCAGLILCKTLFLCDGIQTVELLLRTDDTLIVPAVELTYFLAYLSDIRSCDVLFGPKPSEVTLFFNVLRLALISCFKAWSRLR